MADFLGRSAASGTFPQANFTPAAVTLSGWSYDPITGCFRQGRTAWADVADAKSNVPSLYTLVNGSSLTSAAISSGRMACVFTGNTAYFNGTSTAAHFKRTTSFDLRRSSYERVLRIDFSNNVTTTYAFWTITSSAAGRIGAYVDIFWNGANYQLRAILNDSTITTMVSGLSAGENTAGVWFRVRIENGFYFVDYNRTLGGTTAPTESQWTHGAVAAVNAASSGCVYTSATCTELFGAQVQSGTNTAGFIFASERVGDAPVGMTKPYVPTNTGGYATSAQEFTLYDSVFIGNMTDSVLQTALESRLASLVNTLSGDSSTWTFKIERSSTAATFGGGSFTGLGSLDASGTGPWCRITARSTAGAATAGGSLDLRRAVFSIPV